MLFTFGLLFKLSQKSTPRGNPSCFQQPRNDDQEKHHDHASEQNQRIWKDDQESISSRNRLNMILHWWSFYGSMIKSSVSTEACKFSILLRAMSDRERLLALISLKSPAQKEIGLNEIRKLTTMIMLSLRAKLFNRSKAVNVHCPFDIKSESILKNCLILSLLLIIFPKRKWLCMSGTNRKLRNNK